MGSNLFTSLDCLQPIAFSQTIERFSENFALFFSLALIPTIVWFLVMYRQGPKKPPLKRLLLTFFIGCFSVVPIFAYQKFYQECVIDIEARVLVQNFLVDIAFQGLLKQLRDFELAWV